MMIKRISAILSIVFCCSFSNTMAQDKAMMDAFSQSYEYESTKNYDAAITCINKVYSAVSYEANLRLGWLNYLAAKHKESIVYYQKAASLMPVATEPLWASVNPLVALEMWNEVEKKYIAILKLDNKNTVANYRLGLIYYYRKDYVNAKKYFDVSLNLYPFDYNNMFMSAWTNYFLGNKNEARSLFKKMLLYSPNDKSALEGLALVQ